MRCSRSFPWCRIFSCYEFGVGRGRQGFTLSSFLPGMTGTPATVTGPLVVTCRFTERLSHSVHFSAGLGSLLQILHLKSKISLSAGRCHIFHCRCHAGRASYLAGCGIDIGSSTFGGSQGFSRAACNCDTIWAHIVLPAVGDARR